MVQLFFGLRYPHQLRRTRQRLTAAMEAGIVSTIEASGGTVDREQKYIAAQFDNGAVAFWLDLLTVMEDIHGIIQGAARNLYGHSCIIGRNIPEDSVYQVLRDLSSGDGQTGIWCDEDLLPFLKFYAEFGSPRRHSLLNRSFVPVTAFRTVTETGGGIALRKNIMEALEQRGYDRYMILIGPEFSGIRDGVYHFCREKLGDLPPYTVRFGAGGRGLSCFTDAFTGELRDFLAGSAPEESLREMDEIREILSRERLRDEFSGYLSALGQRFMDLLWENYTAALARSNLEPVLILENIHNADQCALDMALDRCRTITGSNTGAIYCTSRREAGLELWKDIGFRIRVISFPENFNPDSLGRSSGNPLWSGASDLREIAYMCFLMRPYFPPADMVRIFEEDGKNPRTIGKAFSMLYQLGIINCFDDPQPRIRDFDTATEELSDERKNLIASMVRNRMLVWVSQGRLQPCYNLIRALARLGDRGSDDLILDAVCRDVIDGTYGSIEEDLDNETFGAVVGDERVQSLRYIVRTLAVLIHGTEAEIKEVFLYPPPEEAPSPRYRAYMLSNLATYQVGINDLETAAESVKEVMLLSQESGRMRGLARSYRLFSLVNLSQGRLSDAIDYLDFAMDNAGRSEDFEELAISVYYAAGTHYLFGNIAKAERLAMDAEKTALSCGLSSWADRARFFRGRMLFESGRYSDAAELFSAITSNPVGLLNEEARGTLAAWIFRTKIYLGKSDTAPVSPAGWDGSLFAIESAYMAGKYESAVELADRMLIDLPDQDFPYIEQPDWRSGYAQCELLLFPKKDFWRRMINTYRALSLGKISLTSGGDTEQAIHLMQHITRDERFPETDPNDAFYYFALYRILQETGSHEVDMNTAVSMAFKKLQKRASRIDNIEIKRSFLSKHYWNEALMFAAKEHKLI
ncbi:hypothetical protein [Breznakiella homolactica]|uniref:Tetratricopeptide repeat protein n=1 Tax=Breznakiella homolactica TaxID=2798577 RepID=A0A7T7XRJ4_9SPIR|nr:hypothetical protein [Breznakiella homolactica]QQO11124.1 hypothetical protein JFL75_09465 [Breznakiella homolactica]